MRCGAPEECGARERKTFSRLPAVRSRRFRYHHQGDTRESMHRLACVWRACFGILLFSTATMSLPAIARDALPPTDTVSSLNEKRLRLHEEMKQCWMDGNVRAARAIGERIIPLEVELFGPHDDRVASRHHALCSYSLELGEDCQARRHFQKYDEICRHRPDGSWQRVEATRRLALLEKFFARTIEERHRLFGLYRQMEQDLKSQRPGRALKAAEEATSLVQELVGERDPIWVENMLRIQAIHILMGNLDQVGNQLDRLQGVLEQVEHPDHPIFAVVLLLFTDYFQRTGNHDRALECAGASIAHFEQSGATYWPEYSLVVAQHGGLLCLESRYRDALPSLRKAYQAADENGVAENIRKEIICNYLCHALQEIARSESANSNWKDAEALLEEALAVATRIWGPDFFRTVDLRLDLEFVRLAERWSDKESRRYAEIEALKAEIQSLLESGELIRAIKLAEARHSGLAELLGERSAATLRARFDVLSLMIDQELKQEGLTQSLKTRVSEHIDDLGEHFGENHVEYANACSLLARSLDAEDPMATKFAHKAVKSLRESMATSDDYVIALTLLGKTLARQTDPEAVTVLREAIGLWETRPSRGSLRHCEAVFELGAYFYEVGDPYEARPLLSEVARLLRAVQGGDFDIELAVALNYLGNLSSDRDAHEDALDHYREAIHLFETTPWNPKAPHFYRSAGFYVHSYQWTLYNAANSLFAVGRDDDSERVLLKLLKRFPDSPPSQADAFRSACYSLVRIYAKQDRIPAAEDLLDRAAAAVEAHYANDPLIQGELLLETARLSLEAGKQERAVLEFDSSFERFQKIKSPETLAVLDRETFRILITRLANGYERLDQWDRVAEVMEFALPFDEVIYANWPGILAVSRLDLQVAEQIAVSDAHVQRSYKLVRSTTEELARLAESDDAEVDEMRIETASQALADLRDVLGQFSLPAIAFWEALADYREYRQDHAEAFSLATFAFAGNLQLLGESHANMARSAIRAGRLARMLGEYENAKEFLESGLVQLKAFAGEHSIDVTGAQSELARLYLNLEDFAAALPLARSAVDGYHRLWGENNLVYAQNLELMGLVYGGLHEPALAHDYVLQSHEVLSSLLEPTDHRLLRSQTNLAVATSWDPNRTKEARSMFENVIVAYRNAEREWHLDFTEALLAYGDALVRWKEDSAAEELFREAAEVDIQLDWLADDAIHASILARLGATQRRLAKLEDARRSLGEAERLQRKLYGDHSPILSDTMLQLATVSALLGENATARSQVEESLRIQQEAISHVGTLMSQAALTEMLGSDESGLDLLISLLIDSPPSEDEIEQALYWTLQRKGLALDLACQTRALQRSRLFDSTTVEQVNKLQLLNQQAADLALRRTNDSDANAIRQRRELLATQIAELNSELSQSLHLDFPSLIKSESDVSDLHHVLPDGTMLIEFLKITRPISQDTGGKADSHYVAFVILGGTERATIQYADLGNAEEIDGIVEELRKHTTLVPRMLQLGSEADLEQQYIAIAKRLHDRLLQPLSANFSAVHTLIVSPDARLNVVPFGALVDPTGRYVIEKFDISYVSSARDLLRSHDVTGQGTIVISDPNFDADIENRQKVVRQLDQTTPLNRLIATRGVEQLELRSLRWTRLPGAQREARDVERLLVASKYAPVSKFMGDEAVEEVLKSAHPPRIIHLATHGFYVPEEAELDDHVDHWPERGSTLARLRTAKNPLLRSGIVLAGANRTSGSNSGLDDGWVTALEIARLDFSGTELIVLSACESGLGDVTEGQGVHGLRRAFINAGAHSVLTSLFEVPDEETQVLMRSFYETLLETTNRRSALSRAQRERIEQRREANGAAHPFFWASFILLDSAA